MYCIYNNVLRIIDWIITGNYAFYIGLCWIMDYALDYVLENVDWMLLYACWLAAFVFSHMYINIYTRLYTCECTYGNTMHLVFSRQNARHSDAEDRILERFLSFLGLQMEGNKITKAKHFDTRTFDAL